VKDSFAASAVIGLVNLLFTVVAMTLVDKAGPASLASGGPVRAGRRSGSRWLDVSCQYPRLRLVAGHPGIYRGVCHGTGTDTVDPMLRNFPNASARARHVHLHLCDLDLMLHRGANISGPE